MTGGRVKGRDSVREYWQRQWSNVDPRAESLAFEDDEADVHQVVHDCQIERMDIREAGASRSGQ